MYLLLSESLALRSVHHRIYPGQLAKMTIVAILNSLSTRIQPCCNCELATAVFASITFHAQSELMPGIRVLKFRAFCPGRFCIFLNSPLYACARLNIKRGISRSPPKKYTSTIFALELFSDKKTFQLFFLSAHSFSDSNILSSLSDCMGKKKTFVYPHRKILMFKVCPALQSASRKIHLGDNGSLMFLLWKNIATLKICFFALKHATTLT
jgi:hypothetical protein